MSKTFTLKPTPAKNVNATSEPAAMSAAKLTSRADREGEERMYENQEQEVEKDPDLPLPSAKADPKPFRIK